MMKVLYIAVATLCIATPALARTTGMAGGAAGATTPGGLSTESGATSGGTTTSGGAAGINPFLVPNSTPSMPAPAAGRRRGIGHHGHHGLHHGKLGRRFGPGLDDVRHH